YDFGGNGDGTLLYPGTPAVIGGVTNIPVASIRLKMIRKGFEDYEYMKLVSDLGDPGFAQQTGQTLFPNIYQSAQSPDAFHSAREALANRILTLKGSSATGTTIFPSSAVPASANIASSPVEMGVKFRSDVNGKITGIRFYKVSGDTSVHTG